MAVVKRWLIDYPWLLPCVLITLSVVSQKYCLEVNCYYFSPRNRNYNTYDYFDVDTELQNTIDPNLEDIFQLGFPESPMTSSYASSFQNIGTPNYYSRPTVSIAPSRPSRPSYAADNRNYNPSPQPSYRQPFRRQVLRQRQPPPQPPPPMPEQDEVEKYSFETEYPSDSYSEPKPTEYDEQSSYSPTYTHQYYEPPVENYYTTPTTETVYSTEPFPVVSSTTITTVRPPIYNYYQLGGDEDNASLNRQRIHAEKHHKAQQEIKSAFASIQHQLKSSPSLFFDENRIRPLLPRPPKRFSDSTFQVSEKIPGSEIIRPLSVVAGQMMIVPL